MLGRAVVVVPALAPRALVVALALAGCSAVVAPDTSRLDPDPGPMVIAPDAGPPPVGPDAGEHDAGAADAAMGTDAGSPAVDAGPGCTGEPRCDGEVRTACEDGAERRDDCAARGAFCEAGECRAQVCAPGSRACSVDRRSVLECDARGSAQTTEACSLFCDDRTASCAGDPGGACAGLPSIAVGGTARFSLCTETDGNTFARTTECPSFRRASAGDRTFLLAIPSAGSYVVDLRDADNTRSIDTIVSLRRVCDDVTTQVACHDDVPCGESDVTVGSCTGGRQVRQSRITRRLEPGVYYVVADAFRYDAFDCGTVELRVREATP